MKFFTLLLIFLLSFDMSSQEISNNLDDFDEIKVYSGLRLILTKANENKAVVTGNNREEVNFQNDNGVLRIKMSFENIWDEEDNTVVQVFYKEINTIEAKQNCSVIVEDVLHQKRLALAVQEGAGILTEIEVEHLSSKAITGGEIEVTGSAMNQDIIIGTGGKFYAKNLISENINVTINAGGVADIYAKIYVDAQVRAGGTVNIFGDPDLIDKKTTFGGKIRRIN